MEEGGVVVVVGVVVELEDGMVVLVVVLVVVSAGGVGPLGALVVEVVDVVDVELGVPGEIIGCCAVSKGELFQGPAQLLP